MHLFIKYIRVYWLTALLIGYMSVSVIVKSITEVDLTVPCMIKLCTGHSCYGCGLTTAVTHLLRLDIAGAYASNPLVFIVLPVIAVLGWRHWKNFRIEQQK